MSNKPKERRFIKTELRAKRDGGKNLIAGYAAKFGVLSEILGDEETKEFREILLPGCFELSDDIVCNREHDDDDPLARSSSGTLTVTVDDVGLAFEANVAPTQLGLDTMILVERQDLKSCSFAFTVEDEEWIEGEDGIPVRQVKRCIVYDVAIVTHPAYPETEVALRSLAAAQAKAAAAAQPAPAADKVFNRNAQARLSLLDRFFLPHRA